MDKIQELVLRYPALMVCQSAVREAVSLIEDAYFSGNKLLLCGNGGSAADCEHIVGELMKSFLIPRPVDAQLAQTLTASCPEDAPALIRNLQRGVSTISLPSQAAICTAYANDVAADCLFAQLTLGYGKEGDVLLAISTSGNSKSIVLAAETAKALGMQVIGLTGERPCRLDSCCDTVIKAPARETFKVQEWHLPIYHAICAQVEEDLFG